GVRGAAGRLPVERLAIPEATPEELRPLRNRGKRIGALGQQPPQLRMVPAQLVAGGVPVLPDACTQALHLGNELLAGHRLEVLVHDPRFIPGRPRRQGSVTGLSSRHLVLPTTPLHTTPGP